MLCKLKMDWNKKSYAHYLTKNELRMRKMIKDKLPKAKKSRSTSSPAILHDLQNINHHKISNNLKIWNQKAEI